MSNPTLDFLSHMILMFKKKNVKCKYIKSVFEERKLNKFIHIQKQISRKGIKGIFLYNKVKFVVFMLDIENINGGHSV